MLLCATVLWCVVIWQFSLSSGSESAAESGEVMELCNGFFARLGSKIKLSSHTVRKLAHFAEFAVLGVLATATLWQFGFSHYLLLSPAVCAFAATTDECIQLFVPGRGPAVLDVLLDISGGIFGALCAWLLLRFILYIINKKKKSEIN